MNNTQKLKNSIKVETVKAFLNTHKATMGKDDAFYDPKSVAYGIADFLALDFIGEDEPMEALENIALGYAQEHHKSQQLQRKSAELRALQEIDSNQTTNSDMIDEALQPIRGMMAILVNMSLTTRDRDDFFQSQAYDVLYDTCKGVLDKFEALKAGVDYMEDVLYNKKRIA